MEMETSIIYKCFEECGVVTTDSRHCPMGSMFVALKGETFNGNAFAKQALEKGCRYVMIDEKEYNEDILKEACCYSGICKQQNRKGCATIPWKGIEKAITEYEKENQ